MKGRSTSSTGKYSLAPSSVSRHDFWRRNLFIIYQDLLKRWQSIPPYAAVLKTDLYDEAQTDYSPLIAINTGSPHITGIDISFDIAARAQERLKDKKQRLNVVACDVRDLAFKSGSFDLIISTSTLDHFSDKNDITRSLRELCRGLKPGGTLIVTLDNLSNPAIKLRNILPYSFLKSLKVVPYYVGKSLTKPELTRILQANGFMISETVFIDHHPRILTVWLGYALQKIGIKPLEALFQKIIIMFERLQRSLIAPITGYFIAVKAVKKDDNQ